ncbi:MAG: hypothetical protein JW915_24635 [Chitinispirillaceae bacterium]|nr:hypothetical protein [Chitinispirillaceae bacterium]
MSKNSHFFRKLALLVPKVSVKIQLFSATMMWLIGASILLVRGVGYISDRHWHAWVLGSGLALGAIKSRAVLDRIAKNAVARIYARGTADFFGFLSGKSWLFIWGMMGGGMILRRIVVHPGVIGAGVMGAIYIGVGSALLIADRIFIHAFYVTIRSGSR